MKNNIFRIPFIRLNTFHVFLVQKVFFNQIGCWILLKSSMLPIEIYLSIEITMFFSFTALKNLTDFEIFKKKVWRSIQTHHYIVSFSLRIFIFNPNSSLRIITELILIIMCYECLCLCSTVRSVHNFLLTTSSSVFSINALTSWYKLRVFYLFLLSERMCKIAIIFSLLIWMY